MDFGAPKYVPVRQFLLDSSSAGRVGTGPHPKLLKVECRGTSSGMIAVGCGRARYYHTSC